MSKPEDVSERDIEAAKAVVSEWWIVGINLGGLIARAIATARAEERERCAVIVEIATEQGGGATHLSYAGPDIATAIRKGEP